MISQPWNDFPSVSALVANTKRKEPYDVYCGRPGPWENPFPINARTTRRQAVERHQQWLNDLIDSVDVTPYQLATLTTSQDAPTRRLGCFCAPQLCHCHTLARYSLAANHSAEALCAVMHESTADWYATNTAAPYPQPQTPALFDIRPPDQSIPAQMGDTSIEASIVRTILTPQKGRVSFVGAYDYTINPFQGCAAACDFCYAAAYTGSQELTDRWGLWVKAKSNAADILAREAHLLDDARIYMATVTDPYQPVERHANITGAILDVMAVHTPRLVVQTRFPLVTRDIPRFQAIIDNGGMVQVNMTIATDDDSIRRAMEPKCPSIPARLRALTELSAADITACATITPMLPIQDPDQFAQTLLDTGIRKVIIQEFHTSQGSGQQFRRSTRPAALQWMHDNWGPDWRQPYMEIYERMLAALQSAFPNRVGQGQTGFQPPF